MSLFERDCHICWGFFCLCWYYMHIYQRFPWNVLIASFKIFTKISFGHHFIYIIFWIDHCYASILYSCKLRSLEYFFFVYQLWMQCSLNLFTTMFMNAWILFLIWPWFTCTCIWFIIYTVDFLWLQIRFNTLYDQTLYSLWNPFDTLFLYAFSS